MKLLCVTFAAAALLSTNALARGESADVERDLHASADSSWHGYARPDSAAIKDLQRRLNSSGYNAGPVDGIVGPRTRAAVSEFQGDNGFARTGDLDQATVAKIGMYESAVGATASAAASGSVGAHAR